MGNQLEQNSTPQKEKKRTKLRDLPFKRRAISISLIIGSISLIVNILFSIGLHYSSIMDRKRTGALNWLPGNIILELAILWVAQILVFFLYIKLIPFLSRIFIAFHKILKIFRFNYSIVKTDDRFISIKEVIIGRMIIPYLFSFVMGYWFSSYLIDLGNFGIPEITLYTLLFAYMLMPLACLLITPLWLLDDSGIIAIRKRVENDRSVPTIEGTSVFFTDVFTGSAYTLGIITIVSFLIELFRKFHIEVFLAFWFIILILLPVEIILIIYLYEIFMRKNKEKLHTQLKNRIDFIPKKLVDQIELEVPERALLEGLIKNELDKITEDIGKEKSN